MLEKDLEQIVLQGLQYEALKIKTIGFVPVVFVHYVTMSFCQVVKIHSCFVWYILKFQYILGFAHKSI